MSASAIFRIIGILVVLIIAWQLFIHLLGLFILASVIVGFFALLYFGIRLIWGAAKKSKSGTTPAANTKTQEQPGGERLRVWEAHGGTVLYTSKPSIAELTGNAASGPGLLEDKGSVIRIDNNTVVAVVDNDSSEAVKVKVLNGQSSGKTGWISRSALVKDG